ncbi:MAG TPA: DUF2203 family protein [Stenomitos sp.]
MRFTLDEANALIPELTRRLEAAHTELAPVYEEVRTANEALLACEWKMRLARQEGAPRISMQELQSAWDEAAAHLVATKGMLDEREDAWVRLIQRSAVLVRHLQAGLVDFPAKGGHPEAFFCWQLGEPEIAYWHPQGDHETETRLPLHEPA